MASKILSLGSAYFQIGNLHFPLLNESMLNREFVGSEYVIDPGGSAVHFAQLCKKFGFSPVFIGKVGDDLPGREFKKMLEDEGVEFMPIISPGCQTNLALNFTDDSGNSLMFVSGDANPLLTGDEVLGKLEEALDQIAYVYLGGCFKLKSLISYFPQIISLCQKRGAKVALEHGRVTNANTDEEVKAIKALIPSVDYYLPSKDELMAVFGKESLEQCIGELEKIKPITVIKDSVNGAIGVHGGVVKVPAFQVEVLNAVGAGDSFNAGFLKAHDEGKSFEESIKYGCATAAAMISMKSLPSTEDILKIYNS